MYQVVFLASVTILKFLQGHLIMYVGNEPDMGASSNVVVRLSQVLPNDSHYKKGHGQLVQQRCIKCLHEEARYPQLVRID